MDLIFPVTALARPGETVLADGYSLAPGGKGANQAAAAARAGGEVRMVGSVGDDDFGARVLADLHQAGVDTGSVRRHGLPTGCAAVAVDDRGENQIVVGSGANLATTADQLPEAWLESETYLLMQLEVRPDENWRLLARAHAAGAKSILNAAPAEPVPASALDALDVLVANESEALALARSLDLPMTHAGDLARTLAGRFELACIVTLGARGIVVARPGSMLQVGCLQVTARDTTGAGDAFVGVLTAALDGGSDMAEAAHRASVAAGLACTRAGAMPSLPKAAEIEAHIADLAPPTTLGD
jgi:ribokinase